MSSYHELVAQKEAIEQRIAELRKTERASAIAKVRALVSEFGLSSTDIFSGMAKSTSRRSSVVPAKYQDPITGKTWTGRGISPRWLRDKNKEDYLIAK